MWQEVLNHETLKAQKKTKFEFLSYSKKNSTSIVNLYVYYISEKLNRLLAIEKMTEPQQVIDTKTFQLRK